MHHILIGPDGSFVTEVGQMQLNRRHKVGLFLTFILVGSSLLLDVSAKESVGLALLCLAGTWLVGVVRWPQRSPKLVESQQCSEAPLIPLSTLEVELHDIDAGTDPPGFSGKATSPNSTGSWVWMILSVVIFSGLLSIGVFNLTWQSFAGQDEKAGESSGSLVIPLAALGYSSRRAWQALLKLEPENSPVFRRRHRRFNVIAGACITALLFSAWGLGLVTGKRFEKNKRSVAILTQFENLGPKGAELRARLKQLLSEETPTFEDYYLRCLKLEKVLDEYDQQERAVTPLLNALATGDQPKLAELAKTVQRINQKDAEAVAQFRIEVAKGKELIGLPASQQAAFYKREIMPAEREAARIGEEEIEMMRQAEQTGMKWPSDMKELLRERH